MKIRLICLAVCLTVLLLVCGSAMAANDPLKVAMQLSTTTFSEPGPVTISIQVANSGEGDMEDPVTLYYPNGKQVEEFGAPVLSVGTSKVWTGTWNVTQNQLDAGRVTFKIKYTIYNDDGEKVTKSKNFYKTITYTGAVANVEINRTLSATTASEGQEVQVTYSVVNTGNVAVTDVKITEDASIASKAATIASVAPGARETYTFTTKMGKKNLTSKPSISYSAGGTQQKSTMEAAVIKYGEVYLKASLSADKKGTVVGDIVQLTLNLKNSGKTDYTGLTVTDAVLGKVFTDVSVKAGESVSLTRSVTLSDTVDYQFSISGSDSDGADLALSSDRVTVTALHPDQVINLTVQAEADRSIVYELPAKVRFRVAVTNNSGLDVSNVVVKASGVTLYTFPNILMGETREFTRDVSINMAGRFQFTASVTNMLSETQSFESNLVPISVEAPTPVPTDVPIVTPPRPDLIEVPTDVKVPAEVTAALETSIMVSKILLGLAAVGVLLLIVAIVGRCVNHAKRSRVKTSFELIGNRDYLASNGAQEPTSAEPAETAAEESKPEIPENMKKLYPEEDKPES